MFRLQLRRHSVNSSACMPNRLGSCRVWPSLRYAMRVTRADTRVFRHFDPRIIVLLCDVRSPAASCQHVHVADDVTRCGTAEAPDDSSGTCDAAPNRG